MADKRSSCTILCRNTRNGLRDLLLADWAEKYKCFLRPIRSPVRRARPLGTTLGKHFPQGLLVLPLTFLRPLFFSPVPTFPRPTSCPWVSEDDSATAVPKWNLIRSIEIGAAVAALRLKRALPYFLD